MNNITLNINGKEVIIPDRSEDRWKSMAMHLWIYLHQDWTGLQFFRWYNGAKAYSSWKEEAIKLYIKSREVSA